MSETNEHTFEESNRKAPLSLKTAILSYTFTEFTAYRNFYNTLNVLRNLKYKNNVRIRISESMLPFSLVPVGPVRSHDCSDR